MMDKIGAETCTQVLACISVHTNRALGSLTCLSSRFGQTRPQILTILFGKLVGDWCGWQHVQGKEYRHACATLLGHNSDSRRVTRT